MEQIPGLKIRSRASGQRAYYWCARAALIRAGYRPKCVRLEYDLSNPDRDMILAHRCRVLQAEMLEWAGGLPAHKKFDGTMRSLCEVYFNDPDSPYQELRPITRKYYAKHMRMLMQAVGGRRVDAVTGADVDRWYKNIAKSEEGKGRRLGYAYLVVSVLKSVVSYGASRGSELCSPNPCIGLREQIASLRFKNAPPRRDRLTYDQVEAFRKAAHALKRPSMALGITLQFDCSLRQRDVIGVVVDGRWEGGLTWGHIGTDGVLRKRTTKTGSEVSHRIADYPDLAAELALHMTGLRLGPIIISETTGLPYNDWEYRRWFRTIARAAGIPDTIWNMDARAGAVTEAYEAGARTEGAMALAGHTQASTSRRYLRDTTEQSSTVARLRVESRKKE